MTFRDDRQAARQRIAKLEEEIEELRDEAERTDVLQANRDELACLLREEQERTKALEDQITAQRPQRHGTESQNKATSATIRRRTRWFHVGVAVFVILFAGLPLYAGIHSAIDGKWGGLVGGSVPALVVIIFAISVNLPKKRR